MTNDLKATIGNLDVLLKNYFCNSERKYIVFNYCLACLCVCNRVVIPADTAQHPPKTNRSIGIFTILLVGVVCPYLIWKVSVLWC